MQFKSKIKSFTVKTLKKKIEEEMGEVRESTLTEFAGIQLHLPWQRISITLNRPSSAKEEGKKRKEKEHKEKVEYSLLKYVSQQTTAFPEFHFVSPNPNNQKFL